MHAASKIKTIFMRIVCRGTLVPAFACCLTVLGAPNQLMQLAPAPQTSPAQSGKRFPVTGSVANSVTGEPLRKPLVQISGPEQHSVFTGADGRFQLDSVVEGDYFASAQKPGFFQEGSSRNSGRFNVNAGSPPVLIKLVPQASIEGRIGDEDGEPIEGLSVQCLREAVVNGRKTWQATAFSTTDERGVFNVGNLQPGAYLIKTGTKLEFPGLSERSGASALQRVYPAQFYPGGSSQSSAQAITVQPGETAPVNFSIAPVPSFMISGRTAVVNAQAFAAVEDEEGEQVSQTFVDPKTGTWTARAIPAGSWKVISRTGENLYAEQSVQVTSSNVSNVQLVPQALPSIPLMIAAASNEEAQSLAVVLRGQKWARTGDLGAAQQSERRFFQQVPPGSYRVIVQNTPRGCIESVVSGGIDLTRSMLTITSGSQPPPIQLTVTENCAGVAGRVQGDLKDASAFVVLIPESLAQDPLIMQSAASDGSFSFNALTPGNYQAYAFSSIDDLEYANPDALREFSGESLSLPGGQQWSVSLKLNTRK